MQTKGLATIGLEIPDRHKMITELNFTIFESFSVIPAL